MDKTDLPAGRIPHSCYVVHCSITSTTSSTSTCRARKHWNIFSVYPRLQRRALRPNKKTPARIYLAPAIFLLLVSLQVILLVVEQVCTNGIGHPFCGGPSMLLMVTSDSSNLGGDEAVLIYTSPKWLPRASKGETSRTIKGGSSKASKTERGSNLLCGSMVIQ